MRLKTLDGKGYINTFARHFTRFYWKLTKDWTRGIRLFYCRFGQGYQNVEKILAPTEETGIFTRNINSPVIRIFFFNMIREFIKNFPDKEKIIEYQKQRKCQKFTASVQKKFEIIRRSKKQKKKKKWLRRMKKKVFSKTYILHDKAGMVKPTFVSELE